MSITEKSIIDEIDVLFKQYQGDIPKKELFLLAKELKETDISEVESLLKNENHDYRVVAVAILDWKARNKKTTTREREQIFKAYINNHKWIDDWGLVDRAAPYVVGGYLYDKDRTFLDKLAESENPMERRTAIVSTYYFIRKNEIEDTFRIAEILVYDKDEYVQKAVGSWIREAGKRNIDKLKKFLDKHAVGMPRITLRYAIEKFDSETRKYYLTIK